MASVGRPRTCECGTCKTCKHRVVMARWWASKTPEERAAIVARRDKEKERTGARRRYAANPEAVLAKNRGWEERNPEQARGTRRRSLRKWREQNPEKTRAHNLVHHALRAGRLLRQPCEVCGTKPTHAHHDDYSQPLEVRWLCRPHHDELHRGAEAAA